MKLITNIFYYALVAAVAVIGLMLLVSMVPIPGNFDIKVVKSGSMEPAIKTGAIVAVLPAKSYAVGDVITFGADTKAQIPTTHRVIEVLREDGSTMFRTKGDANDVADPIAIRESDVRGKVIFSAPYAGYLLDFAKKPIGFGLLVGVPALAVIIDELMKIFREVSKLRSSKKKRITTRLGFDGIKYYVQDTQPVALENLFDRMTPTVKVLAIFGIGYASLFGLPHVGGTISYFSDSEISRGNVLQAGSVNFLLSSNNDVAGRALAKSFVTDDEESAYDTEDEAVGTETFMVSVGIDDQSLPLLYTVSGEIDNDSPQAACKLMTVDAVFGDYVWSGFITDLYSPPTSTTGDWLFTVSLPKDNPSLAPGAACEGNIVFRATPVGTDGKPAPAFSQEQRYAFELYNWDQSDEATSTLTHQYLSGALTVDDAGTTTPGISEDTATSTPDIATTTPEVASTTPDIATTTPDVATTTPVSMSISSSSEPAPTPTPEETEAIEDVTKIAEVAEPAPEPTPLPADPAPASTPPPES